MHPLSVSPPQGEKLSFSFSQGFRIVGPHAPHDHVRLIDLEECEQQTVTIPPLILPHLLFMDDLCSYEAELEL
jgi:hypothetical protein